MQQTTFLYGNKRVKYRIEQNNLSGVLDVKDLPVISDKAGEFKFALDHPIGTKPFDIFFKKCRSVGIIVSDITRAPSAKIYLPYLLSRLNKLGINDKNIFIIFSTGTHRLHTRHEHNFLVGSKIYKRVRVYDHDARDKNSLVFAGRTKSGNEIFVNKRAYFADGLIATGKIDFHYFAGYGGGRKSILPGVCGLETIQYNHRLCLHNKYAAAGSYRRNPVNLDMLEAAKLVGPVFMINVVLNKNKQICKFFAGDIVKAHRSGCKFIDRFYRPRFKKKADMAIISAGGYPQDINFVQAHKAIDNSQMVVKENGVMIVLAECRDGFGSSAIRKYFSLRSLGVIEKHLKNNFAIAGHTVHAALSKAKKFKIILVSSFSRQDTEMMGMIYSRSLKQAIKMSAGFLKKNYKAYIIPDAASILPKH